MTTTWTLPTASGGYVVGLAPTGQPQEGAEPSRPAGLVLHHWGRTAAAAPAPPRLPRRAAPFEGELDLLPLEATALGTRDVHGAEIVARRSDGVRGLRLALTGEVVLAVEDDGGHHLTCPLSDEVVGVEVELHLRSHPGHDVVTKWARVSNRSSLAVELLRGWGGAFEVPVGPGARIDVLSGAWSREVTPAVVDLAVGTLSIGSRQGITSPSYSPVLTLRPRGQETGVAYAVALAWSGSWRMSADAVPFVGHVRVAGGPDDESGVLTLGPGEEYVTPALAGLRADGDADDVAHAWHTYQRTLARTTGPEHRPVVYNSWYATTFDVQVEHQVALADVAAQVGAEVFVVDDGWFRGRTSDRAGLGDWDVDADKFPEGLQPLIDAVAARGMRFGIWVEPEAVNPDSNLYRAHPDWVHHVAGRPRRTLRNQLVLDLGRPEVEAWVTDMLRRLLSSADITYLKWDMNRSIADGGQSLPGGDDWSWRHTQAYLRVMDVLRQEHPQVTVEACAGGGGRIDLAVLERSDVVWPSDETGPRDRLAIQHGFLSAYPTWVMSSWVTDLPDVLDGAGPVSLEFRLAVAMAGVLGIGSDLLGWDDPNRERAAAMVSLYRSVRHVVHTGRVRRHGDPADAAYAVQVTAGDDAVVLAWRRPGGPDGTDGPGGTGGTDGRDGPDGTAGWRVRLRDLDPAGSYRVRAGGAEDEGVLLTGAALAGEGLVLGWTWGDCDVVVLRRE